MPTSWPTLDTTQGTPAAADVLVGQATATVTQAATTFMSVPAGRTWVGTIAVNCACAEAGAGAAQGQATAVITTAGANVTPAAGTVLRCDAYAGANVAGGTVGSDGNNSNSVPMVVVAPGANAVTLQLATTQTGTTTVVNVTASGLLV